MNTDWADNWITELCTEPRNRYELPDTRDLRIFETRQIQKFRSKEITEVKNIYTAAQKEELFAKDCKFINLK